MMKNTLKLIVILLFTITFGSCKNEVQKRIELIEKITDSLNKSLDNLKDIKQITLANEKVQLIKDSIYKISTDKKYKSDYLNDYFVKIDSTEKKLLRKEQEIYKTFATETMIGKYTGFGRNFYEGKYVIGSFDTEVEIIKTGIVEVKQKANMGDWELFKCNFSDIVTISDTLIEGDLILGKNKVCSFKWTPNKLYFNAGAWDSDCKIIH
jgi:hypothetical protein